ncbi:MAG: HAMP domain-containing sensor histidine kinase [Acidimicrobiales bacterium]
MTAVGPEAAAAPAPVPVPSRLGVRPHWPRRTIRVRLALFYFAAFVVSGITLLAATVGLWAGGSTASVARAPGPAAGHLALPGSVPPQIAQHSSDLHHLLIAAGTALVLLAVLSIAFGWLAAGRFLQPLHLITTATREISSTNLHERLRLNGPEDEIKELGDTFDALLERLERSFEAERRFVANASHELRTPLATMRASLDVAIAKPGPVPPQTAVLADRLRRELDHVDRLLASLLTLAQAQRAPSADQGTVSLDALASAAVEQRLGAISQMALRVDQQRCPDAWALGSETLLSRMVDNMVENAVKHNEQGGWLQLQTAVDGQVVRLVVENGGAVLRPEDVKELARPFKRLGAERTGSERGNGLGLSIVQAIAEAHDGVLDLHARSDGGLRVVVTLARAGVTEVGTPQ